MQSFEYANPTTVQEAVGTARHQVGRGRRAGRRHRPHQPDEGAPSHAQARGEHQEHQGARRHQQDSPTGSASAPLVTHGRAGEERRCEGVVPSRCATPRRAFPARRSATWGRSGGDLCQRPRCWYYRQGFGLLAMKDGKSLVPDGENKYHAIFGNGGRRTSSAPSSLGPALVALDAKVKLVSAKGTREVAAGEILRDAEEREQRAKSRCSRTRCSPRSSFRTAASKNATYEVRQKEALDWPLAAASVALKMKGSTVVSAQVVLGHVAPTPWMRPRRRRRWPAKTITAGDGGSGRQSRGGRARSRSARTLTRCTLARVAVKRALLDGARKGGMTGMERPGLTQSTAEPLREAALEGAVHRGAVGSDRAALQRSRLLVPAYLQLPGAGGQNRRRVRVQSRPRVLRGVVV